MFGEAKLKTPHYLFFLKKLHKIIKISARYIFDELRKKSPVFSPVLDTEVKINRKIWNHLLFEKTRNDEEILQRFVTLPLVKDILVKGLITEKRNYEKGGQSFELSFEIEDEIFILIVKKERENFIAHSCFLRHKKNDMS